MLDFSSIQPSFTDDDKPYLAISDIAKRGKYSEDFLFTVAKSGKLKAFKLGDSWLTNEDWYNDWQETIRRAIDSELAEADDDFIGQSKWLKPMAKPEPSGLFNYYAWAAVFWLLLLFFSVFQLFFWTATGLVSTDGQIINIGSRLSIRRDMASEVFLSASNGFYSGALNLAGQIARADYPVDDERLTDWLAGFWDHSGKVAGDSDRQNNQAR